MALAGIKLDADGSSIFATNCFPVRSVQHRDDDGGGAWAVSHRAEQRRRFKAVLCTKPRTYSRIKEERKKCEKEGTSLTDCKFEEQVEEDDEEEVPNLNGFFLMKHCCVDDPSDLCSINISGKEFVEVEEDDLTAFDNVAYVNAAENYLPFEAYRGFPTLRELEIPLCGLRSLKIGHNDYPNLELLDLSYNNLSQEDILTVGTLPRLKVLHLTGNDFNRLPHDFCLPFIPEGHKNQYPRFAHLEVLMLDDNKLSDITIFAAIAGLQKLKHLNLEKNAIFFIPQLKSVEGQMKTQDGEKSCSRKNKTPRSGCSSRRSKSRQSALEAKLEELTNDVINSEKANAAEQPDREVNDESADHQLDTENRKDKLEEITKAVEEKNKETSDLLDEDFNSSLGDLSARIHDVESDIKGSPTPRSTARKPQSDAAISRTAFPELRYLSLAYNQIATEEGLLAVAAWPMLSELVIHDNPLTTDNVGDPPLIKRFLHDRLGIKLVRKRVAPVVKKHIEIPDRPKRRVTTQVPKIPRPTVEQRLMLEAPINSDERPTTSGGKSPLPPIDTRRCRAASAGELPRQQKEEITPRSEAWADEDELEGETFFMTQVDDENENKSDRRKPEKMKKTEKELDEKYRGFEDLLSEDDFPLAREESSQDIQSNVRALRYALNHQLVYRDTSKLQLDAVKKPVKPYRRVPLPPPGPRKTHQEKVDEVLDNLRDRSTVDEASLKYVLKNKTKLRKQFPEAQTLLAQIQHRYNAVRVTSMKEAKDAKKEVQDAINRSRASSKMSGVKVQH
ncbi:hypothetical protein SNE40_000023 [Patella caerulea]|uniref:X-ray radiation resistance-associated protein 1 n=1 Tax=Patella caerulea TaxID=87958 RepID=A0AAN8Q1Q9_PATCE